MREQIDSTRWRCDRCGHQIRAAAITGPCPHIVTSDEGTQHCTLAERSTTTVDEEEDPL